MTNKPIDHTYVFPFFPAPQVNFDPAHSRLPWHPTVQERDNSMAYAVPWIPETWVKYGLPSGNLTKLLKIAIYS